MSFTAMSLKRVWGPAFLAATALGQSVSQQDRLPAQPDLVDCKNALKVAEELKDQKQWSKALDLYKRAWECHKDLGSPRTDGEIHLNMGRVQGHLSTMKQEALDSFKAAAEDLQKVEAPDEEVRTNLAAAELNVAIALTDAGLPDQTSAHFAKALELFSQLHDIRGQTVTLSESARASYLQGESDFALHYGSLVRSIPETPDNLEGKASALDFMGRTLADLEDQGIAVSYFNDALDLAQHAKYHRFIAYTLNDLGIILSKQNKPAEAKRNHEEALRELEKYESNNLDGIAETTAYLADAEFALGERDAAFRHYRDALNLQEESKDFAGQAQTHFSLGRAQLAAGDRAAALKSFTKASMLYQQVHNRIGEANAHFQAAQLLQALRDDDRAKAEIGKGLEIAEEVRNFTPGRMLRASYFSSVEQMYRLETSVLLESSTVVSEQEQQRAFERFQLAQARTLKDALSEKISSTNILTSPTLRARREKLLEELGRADRKLSGLLKGGFSARVVDEAYVAVRRQEVLLEQLEAEEKAREPRLSIFSNALSAQEVQQRMLDPESAFIQFYLAEPSSYAWVITQSTIALVKLPAKKILEDSVRRSVQFKLGGQWTPAQQRAVDHIRRSLAPVFEAAEKKRWIVVPDGGLHSFPFAMLTAGQGQSAAPEEIVKVPSASAVDMVRRFSRPTPAHTLVVVADPVFDDRDSRVGRSKTARRDRAATNSGTREPPPMEEASLPRLRYSGSEANAISHLYPPEQTRLFLDFAATRKAASGDALRDFRMIHLATHSLTDERHPELSRIVFSRVTPTGVPQEGDLFAKDIYEMNLSADLVVLSSCQSAIGKQQPGEGPMSLSRAFLFAGSKAVVASLWEVDDQATADLMRRFYQYMLRDRLAPASALARAQSDFRDPHGRYRNPYYWAGFEVYGEWRPK